MASVLAVGDFSNAPVIVRSRCWCSACGQECEPEMHSQSKTNPDDFEWRSCCCSAPLWDLAPADTFGCETCGRTRGCNCTRHEVEREAKQEWLRGPK